EPRWLAQAAARKCWKPKIGKSRGSPRQSSVKKKKSGTCQPQPGQPSDAGHPRGGRAAIPRAPPRRGHDAAGARVPDRVLADARPRRADRKKRRPPHMTEPHRYGADPGPRESDIITPRSKP